MAVFISDHLFLWAFLMVKKDDVRLNLCQHISRYIKIIYEKQTVFPDFSFEDISKVYRGTFTLKIELSNKI